MPISKQIRKVGEYLLRMISAVKTIGISDCSYLLAHFNTESQKHAINFWKSFEGELIPIPVTLNPIRCSILVPYRNNWHLTKKCLQSILDQNLRSVRLQIILIDNGSTEEEIELELVDFMSNEKVLWRKIRVDSEFNFSRLNNTGALETESFAPKYYLFLNNDVELTDDLCLEKTLLFKEMLGAKCGAVGCTLLYPNNKIQHLFLAPGIKIVGGHPLKGMPYDHTMVWFECPRPVAAVTGAFLLVSVEQFAEVGGFDESLATAYQDLDLCLKLQNATGVLSNWVLPGVICTHFENATRRKKHNWKETEIMYGKWANQLSKNKDFSDVFSKESEFPTLKLFRWI